MGMGPTGRHKPVARWLEAVATVALAAAVLPATLASAGGGQDLALRLEGASNVDYAIAWSQLAHPDADIEAGQGPETVLLGRDDLFADNLASGALQGDRPLLLTGSAALGEAVRAELERLGADNVTILGGENAVSSSVADELQQLGYTVGRLSGSTRIETAIAIAEENGSDTAILARGFAGDDPTQAFADSLAAGGWAAAQGWDILLTQTDVLTGNTANHIQTAGYERVIIVGGVAAISQDVEDAVAGLVPAVERVAGPTRFDTAVEIARARGFATSADAEITILVDGQGANGWADGFSAAHLSGLGYPIVLSNAAAQELPPPTRDFLVADGTAGASYASHLDEVDLICGSSVPDGDSEGEPDQCAEAAELMGLRVVRVPLQGELPPEATVVQEFPGGGEQPTDGWGVTIDGQLWVATGGEFSVYWGTLAHDQSVVFFLMYGTQPGAIPSSDSVDPDVAAHIATTFVDNLTVGGSSGPQVDWASVFAALDADPAEVCGGRIVLNIDPDQGGPLPGFDESGDLRGSGPFTGQHGDCDSFQITLRGTIDQSPTPEPTSTDEPTPEPTSTSEPTPEPTSTGEPTPEPTSTYPSG